jgi:hypothetical protein
MSKDNGQRPEPKHDELIEKGIQPAVYKPPPPPPSQSGGVANSGKK